MKYTAEIVEAEDGTDDVILQLPPDFCKDDDWREGDTIKWGVENGQVIMTNLSKVERENLSNQTSPPLDKPVHDT